MQAEKSQRSQQNIATDRTIEHKHKTGISMPAVPAFSSDNSAVVQRTGGKLHKGKAGLKPLLGTPVAEPLSGGIMGPKTAMNTILGKLTEVEFEYGQFSDCLKLAQIAKGIGAESSVNTIVEIKSQRNRVLVPAGKIKGDARTSNTDGIKMWFFEEHHWCAIGTEEFDPLFGKAGKPDLDIELRSQSHRGELIYIFSSGKCAVVASEGLTTTKDVVFGDLASAQQFVTEKTPGYDPDASWD